MEVVGSEATPSETNTCSWRLTECAYLKGVRVTEVEFSEVKRAASRYELKELRRVVNITSR